MKDIAEYEKHKNAQPSEEDYGFNVSFQLARRLYWQRRGSQAPVYAESGAYLDQPMAIEDDIRTYGWLVDIAEGQRKKEKKIKEVLFNQRES